MKKKKTSEGKIEERKVFRERSTDGNQRGKKEKEEANTEEVK